MRSSFLIGFAFVVMACGDDTTGTGSGGGSSSSAASTSGSGTTTSSSSQSASSGGDGGDATASSGNTGGGGAGQGGGNPEDLTMACERWSDAAESVSDELGCPAETPDGFCLSYELFEGCFAPWTAFFECLADNTTLKRCTCESFGEGAGGGVGVGGSGGFGEGGGSELACDYEAPCADESQALAECNGGGAGGGKTAGSGGSF